MVRGLATALVGGVLAVALVGCGGSADDASGGGGSGGTSGGGSGGGSAAVFEAGDSITVKNGATFVVALAANPSTGYSWSAAANPNATYRSSEQVQGRSQPGASGTQRLTFAATAPGSSTLVLNYARPFEPGVPPVQTQSFPLTVKG